jgi:hypothetical protein
MTAAPRSPSETVFSEPKKEPSAVLLALTTYTFDMVSPKQ